MRNPSINLTPAEHDVVTAAVVTAEANTDGEIVTIVAERSDGYSDVATGWAAFAAFLTLSALVVWPECLPGLIDRATGAWASEWTTRDHLVLALVAATSAFAAIILIQLLRSVRYALVPGPIRSDRVRNRASDLFKVGAERRTLERTGVLIYLSMREHRAEIVADSSIADKVAPDVWGEAMAVMLAEVREGRTGEGIAKAVTLVGAVLAEHFPKTAADSNEIPDRLIEL